MRLLQQYRFFALFVVLLVFCTVMVIRQFNVNRARHVELREAFILLQAKGWTNEAQRLFTRLINEVSEEPDKILIEDFQRTMMLVDPGTKHPENLIWTYHWTVSNELE